MAGQQSADPEEHQHAVIGAVKIYCAVHMASMSKAPRALHIYIAVSILASGS
jgi:hypothetical protein